MSFPRILPDSSYFPGFILKFISKFDIRMIHHQSHVFLQDLLNSFHRWLYLFAFDSFGVSKWFMVVFLVVFLGFWRPKKSFSSISCSILFKIHGAILLPSSHICFDCENPFHPSRAIHDSFQFDSPKAVISRLFILSFQLSLSKSYRCIIQAFYNQLVILAFTCI